MNLYSTNNYSYYLISLYLQVYNIIIFIYIDIHKRKIFFLKLDCKKPFGNSQTMTKN